jgi:hypothetical protein
MIHSLKQLAKATAHTHGALPSFLSRDYSVYDWIRLGLFTGSRISEYGQVSWNMTAASPSRPRTSTASSPKRYARVPTAKSAGPWAGTSIAFIASDFTFWNHSSCSLPLATAIQPTAHRIIAEVHIRFRFDKSKHNFTIRKYKRIPTAAFDPVLAVINILRRAHIMKIPSHEPLGQYRTLSGSDRCLRDSDVRDGLRAACIAAYPDPTHYCRIHITGLVTHSNRVTAALCLQLGGTSIDDIAFRLRWQPASVPTYLRECFLGIDTIMQKAIAGTFLLH